MEAMELGRLASFAEKVGLFGRLRRRWPSPVSTR